MTFMSLWRSHYTVTVKHAMLNKCSFSFTTCEVLRHTAPFCGICPAYKTHSMNSYLIFQFEHKNDITVIANFF